MARAKVPKDEVEYVKKRIWVELKDDLDVWVKKKFSFLAVVVTIGAILGPITLVKMFVGDEVKSELASWKKDIIKVQFDAEKASVQAQEAAISATASTEKSVKVAKVAVQKAVSDARAATKNATESTTKSVKAAEVAVQKAVSDAEAAIMNATKSTTGAVKAAEVAVQKAVSDAEAATNTATESTAGAIKAAQVAVQIAVSDAEAATKNATESTAEAVKAAKVAVQKAVSDAEAATKIAEDKARAAESAAEKALAELDRLRASMAQTTGRLLERRGEISSIRLTEGDKAAILVRQIPRKTGEKTSQGNEWVELDFKLEIDASKTNRSSKEILNQVVKVEYGFDERWFRPPVRTAINPANGFEYSMRVWGVTEVKAVVHISLPDEKGSTAERRTEKIVFEGWMKLDGRGSLKRVKVSP